MSSDDEEYVEENFQCTRIIAEEHNEAIYGICVCHQAIPEEDSSNFYFATCAKRQICVYKHEKSSVRLIQSYVDGDNGEYFYDCKWTTFNNRPILAAGGLRGVVRLVDVVLQKHLKPLRHLSSVNQIAFSAGRPNLMASACSNFSVMLWDAEAALCLANYGGPEFHTQGVLSVDFNYAGTTIVSGGLDNSVCLWSTDDIRIKENFNIAQRGPLFSEFRLSAPVRVYWPIFHSKNLHEHYVDSVKWLSEDLLLSKSADHVYCIWKFVIEKKQPEILFRWHRTEKSGVIFDVRLGLSPRRKLMAIGRLDGTIFLWNMTVLPIQPIVLSHRESKSMVRNIDFTHDGNFLVASNENGQIFVWKSIVSQS